MINSSEKIIGTLNDLVQINHDRSQGYKLAATETKDAVLKGLFSRYALQSETFASELAGHVIKYGGEPTDGTRTDGKLYRVWMEIKAALSGNDRSAVLNSCEYGEDVAVKSYEDALNADVILPADTRDLISTQKEAVENAHDTIKNLRNTSEKSIV